MKFVTVFTIFVGVVAVGVLLGALFAFPVMWLWNWLMPDLFGLPTIVWNQAWGLMILCSLLFKSHGANASSNN